MAILLACRRREAGETALFVTRYHKWYTEERDTLFQGVAYTRSGIHEELWVFPKLGSPLEEHLARKVLDQDGTLASLLAGEETASCLYYKITGVGHWFNITRRPPKFWWGGRKASSSREELMYFHSDLHRDLAFCVLNSTLFYWFYQLRTNCRDFNPSDYRTFPLPPGFGDRRFKRLADDLQAALDGSVNIVEATSKKTGAIRYEQFRPREAKPIIDEIDRVLAAHYGFTDEELDFIINYDIKYRMGGAAETDD
jgi:hypothetical protein